MSSRTLPNLGLKGFWGLGFNGYDGEMDNNLLTLSVLVQGTVLSLVAALPGSPADGDRHIITAGADEDKIAIRDNGAWVKITPAAGWVMFNLADNKQYRYDGSAWAIDGAAGGTAIQSNATANLTKGYTATAHNLGTPASGATVTPDPTNGNMQRMVNNAAFTLAAPTNANDSTIVIQLTNSGAAGAITLTGFSKVTGDTLTTTSGDDFMLAITKINGLVWLNVVALQ